MHHGPLIATVAAGLVLAFAFGALAHRLRLPPIAGYLLAGVAIGPATPGFVADVALANELAEIGVILLMFGVGLHFSVRDLLAVRAVAVPGALAQIAAATALGLLMALVLGWGVPAGIVFGLALSVASTVVLLRALQERRLTGTERGRIAVGWLVVEDLAMVLALVLLPAFAEALGGGAGPGGAPLAARFDLGLLGTLAATLGKVALFAALMLVVGRRLIPMLLHWAAHTGSRELFRLAVLAIALGVATGAALVFGVSFALGAFFAGMVLAESQLSQRAAQESLPLRDAFAVLFFVSVGMLFDPAILARAPLEVLATLAIVVVGKSAAAYALVRGVYRRSRGTALTIAASLAQIGEFSFILAGLGVTLGLLPGEGRDLVLAGAILSILLNPLAFALVDRLAPPASAAPATAPATAPGEPTAVAAATAAAAGSPPAAASSSPPARAAGGPGAGVAAPESPETAPPAAGPVVRRLGSADARERPDAGAAAPASDEVAAGRGRRPVAAPAVPLGGGDEDDAASRPLAPTTLAGHTVLAGYGRVGHLLGEGLRRAGEAVLVVEESAEALAAARGEGAETLAGNAADPRVLAAANLPGARRLLVALADPFEAGSVVQEARRANPALEILARAHGDAEAAHLLSCGATRAVVGEDEVARAMLAAALPPDSAAPAPRSAPRPGCDTDGPQGTAAPAPVPAPVAVG